MINLSGLGKLSRNRAMPAFLSNFRAVTSVRYRCVTSMLLVVYVATMSGIPLPVGHVVRKSGEMYPCANCACGCASAEQCWRSCCCHSLAERIAWARRHGVRPPEFAIAAARQARIDLSWLVEPGKACCARELVASAPKCCQAGNGCCDRQEDHEHGQSKSESSKVIGWKALNCQGHSSTWVAAVPPLTSAKVELTTTIALLHWLGPLSSEEAISVVSVPATPPPQSA